MFPNITMISSESVHAEETVSFNGLGLPKAPPEERKQKVLAAVILMFAVTALLSGFIH